MMTSCTWLSRSPAGETRMKRASVCICSMERQPQSAEDREEKYGRPLGRVLAHELYHIFADTMCHGSNGVAKKSYGGQDLLSNAFRFQSKDSRVELGSAQR